MFTYLTFHIHTINFVYASAGLVVFALTIALLVDYYCNQQKLYRRFVEPYVWQILIVTSFGGAATTLLYSEVFGFVPCSLCWLQRVALYPQALLSVLAFRHKDSVHFPLYGMALSFFGFVVAVYQYIYQTLPQEILQSGVLPCLADGSADCSKKVMEVFGFVTFPFLSAVLFAFLFTLYLHLYQKRGNSHD